MALVPLLLDYLERPTHRPSCILDQHFGNALTHSDLDAPLHLRRHHHYYRPWRGTIATADSGSTIQIDKNHFQVNLDVQQFLPEEITVKITGENTITVEGKHEEKQDEHGYISRHFIRRYQIPKGHNLDNVESKLSSDGVLSIVVPKELSDHRLIPIKQTGQPSLAIKEKGEKEEEQKGEKK